MTLLIILIDNLTSTVTVSGVGHKIWREDFFPVVSRLLFAQYVKYADSHILESTTNQQWVIDRTKTDDCAKGLTRNKTVSQDILTASKMKPVHTSTPIVNRIDTNHDKSNSPPVSEIIKRIDHMENELRLVKESVISHFEKHTQDMKTSIFEVIKKAIPNQTYASALQTSSQSSGRKSTTQRDSLQNDGYTDVKRGDATTVQHNQSNNHSTMDEGICDGSNSVLGSSQTFVKTVYPVDRNGVTEAVGQPVPVLITNRDTESTIQNSLGTAEQQKRTNAYPPNTISRTANGKILLIGDSILNNVNTKGLVKGVRKHAKGGARVNDIIEDISDYDMRNFETCIIYVGGNDCAKRANVDNFVDAYDQLISIIKSSNQQCKIYICEIAPRGDTDVSAFNSGIERLCKHWGHQTVYRISNTNAYFFDKHFLPPNRYYNYDGIHLSHSGVKRLLDAINGSVKIVVNYDLCVFSNTKKQNKNGSRDKPTGYSRGFHGPQSTGRPYQPYAAPTGGDGRRSKYRNSRKQCYGCNMVGHILAECWNLK